MKYAIVTSTKIGIAGKKSEAEVVCRVKFDLGTGLKLPKNEFQIDFQYKLEGRVVTRNGFMSFTAEPFGEFNDGKSIDEALPKMLLSASRCVQKEMCAYLNNGDTPF